MPVHSDILSVYTVVHSGVQLICKDMFGKVYAMFLIVTDLVSRVCFPID